MRIYRAGFVCLLALSGCQQQRRELRPAPVRLAIFSDAARESPLQPGGASSEPQVVNPYNANAYAISEGMRLYSWYNCTGCHANGGGAIGPPLIKQEWIYGDQPANLFDTIVKGRPNGMPSWGGRIPEYQVWQIVSYILSMNQQQPQSASPARPDALEKNPHTLGQPPSGEKQ